MSIDMTLEIDGRLAVPEMLAVIEKTGGSISAREGTSFWEAHFSNCGLSATIVGEEPPTEVLAEGIQLCALHELEPTGGSIFGWRAQ